MENNKIQKITNFCIKNIVIVAAIIIGIIGILSIFITAYFNVTITNPVEKTSFKYSFGIIEILLTLLSVFLIAILSKKIFRNFSSKKLLFLLLICAAIPFVYWIKTLQLVPEADQKMIHEMAIAFCR